MNNLFVGYLSMFLFVAWVADAKADGASDLQSVARLAEPSVGNGRVENIQRLRGTFNKTAQLNAIRAVDLNATTRSECRFKVVADRRPNIVSLNPSNGIADTKDLADRLRSLHVQGKIAAILSKQFSGIPASLADRCAVYLFRIFTVDGYWVQITFDHRD